MGQIVNETREKLEEAIDSAAAALRAKEKEYRLKKETIDVTTLGSTGGYREYIGSFKTPGTVDINGFLADGGAEPGQTALMAAYESDDKAAFEVDFPDGSKVTFDAIVKQKAFGPANVGSAIAFRAQLQISGQITFTPKT